jgi:hypothetical protein
MRRNLDEVLRKIEGLQTAETVAKELNLTRQSAINLLSKLKKMEHVTVSGGGKQKRLYKITIRKQRKKQLGMFDIINKYSPMKVNAWYEHQVYGEYGPEEALIDAIQIRSFRIILASLRLYGHIKDWRKLHKLAEEKGVMQEVMALYELARMYFRVKKLPKRYYKPAPSRWKNLTQLKNRNNFTDIQKRWHVYIPFNEADMEEIK